MNERFLQPTQVRALGQRLNLMAGVLRGMSMFVQVQMDVCRAAAFTGLVGTKATERHLSSVKPRLDQLALYCSELAEDAIRSANDWERAGRAD